MFNYTKLLICLFLIMFTIQMVFCEDFENYEDYEDYEDFSETNQDDSIDYTNYYDFWCCPGSTEC